MSHLCSRYQSFNVTIADFMGRCLVGDIEIRASGSCRLLGATELAEGLSEEEMDHGSEF